MSNLPVEGNWGVLLPQTRRIQLASVVNRSSRYAASPLRFGPTGDIFTTAAALARTRPQRGGLFIKKTARPGGSRISDDAVRPVVNMGVVDSGAGNKLTRQA